MKLLVIINHSFHHLLGRLYQTTVGQINKYNQYRIV
nr:MAG TPA_asm: hypothetical protein [Caudoviricetes sp.]